MLSCSSLIEIRRVRPTSPLIQGGPEEDRLRLSVQHGAKPSPAQARSADPQMTHRNWREKKKKLFVSTHRILRQIVTQYVSCLVLYWALLHSFYQSTLLMVIRGRFYYLSFRLRKHLSKGKQFAYSNNS